MNERIWNKLNRKYCPEWLEKMLFDIGALLATDSDSVMWYFENNVLQIEVDKILFYARGCPIKHREYYIEEY